jgi:hypothetical protein
MPRRIEADPLTRAAPPHRDRYALEAEVGVIQFWRDQPGFAQRFTGRLGADGTTIAGVAELCQDGATWEQDLRITFRRVG